MDWHNVVEVFFLGQGLSGHLAKKVDDAKAILGRADRTGILQYLHNMRNHLSKTNGKFVVEAERVKIANQQAQKNLLA